MNVLRVAIGLLLVMTSLPSVRAQQPGPPADIRSENGYFYTVYAENMPGKDWTEKIQRALDRAAAGAGTATVVLPPGIIPITRTIHWSGMPVKLPPEPKIIPRRFAHRVYLRGSGGADSSRLIWKGEPNQPVILITNSPWFGGISDLGIHGEDVEGVIGIRYTPDWDYTYWTTRLNSFRRLYIWKCDVGIDVGDNWGPDVTNLSVYDTWIRQCRICVRMTGANVACIYFYNMIFSNYREAGIKGVIGRSMHIDEVKERLGIEKEDIPKKVLETRMRPNGQIICGGSPSYVIHNVNATTRHENAWLFDVSGGAVRVYSVRHEGVGGVLNAPAHVGSRFSDLLVDVVSTAPGVNGVSINYNRYAPLILVGGVYGGNIKIGAGGKPVFSLGTRFRTPTSANGEPPKFTGNGLLHQMPYMFQRTVDVPAGARTVTVRFDSLHQMPDTDYQVSLTPNWNSGNWWLRDKMKNGFELHFATPPGPNAQVDVTASHKSWDRFPGSK